MMKCPNCKASLSKLTLDANIIVTCTIKPDDTYEVKPFWDWSNINYAAHEQVSEDELQVFCQDCGEFFKVKLNDDFTISIKEDDDK